MLIAELTIPQMFTAYAEDQGHASNGLHHYQYFCEECDQWFAAAWGAVPCTCYFEMGKYFKCPRCGFNHSKYVVYIDRDEKAPNKIRLQVKEYKDVVTLEVSAEAVYFIDYLHVRAHRYREVFRFNIPSQTVTFKTAAFEEPIEIGNPFKLDVLTTSILRFFRSNSLANANYKSDLTHILKTLRDTVHRKLEQRLGYKISSMHVSPGQYCGTFLVPILNIAFRVACPDATNLPTIYRSSEIAIHQYWRQKLIGSQPLLNRIDAAYMDMVMYKTRRKANFISSVIQSNSLPDKPILRKLLSENHFNVKLAVQAFLLCENYDNAISLYQAMGEHKHDMPYWNDSFFDFLAKMKPIYGEEGIIRLVGQYQQLQTIDCFRLYNQLNDTNKKVLLQNPVRLRELHDWISITHARQDHKNEKFEVPAHIIKRLSMQKNRLKFFLPKESIELLEAGHTLHNCVAGYSRAMQSNSEWIVLVADDKGRLVACLQIQNRNKGQDLTQAKMDRNRAVKHNPKLNAAILEWAKKAGIHVSTFDIERPIKEKIKIA